MANAKENMESANDSALELITNIQEGIIAAQKQFADAVTGLVPEVPTTDLPDTPDAKELIEQTFAFQAKLLEANKAFSLGLIDAWTQTSPKSASTKVKASTKN